MYVPSHFEESRLERLHGLIAAHPLGVLITHGSEGLDANHLPFEIDAGIGDHGVLRTHVARNNPLWQSMRNGDEVLVVFRAQDAYISPNWYPSQLESGKQVPTWNYRVVHAHGRIAIQDDEKQVRAIVARLTRTHEAGQPVPWKMGDAPKGHIDAMLKAIVGIEIEITRLIGKFKLSQNRDLGDQIHAGKVLIGQGDIALGQIMAGAKTPKE
jgi:transcriptional regulator